MSIANFTGKGILNNNNETFILATPFLPLTQDRMGTKENDYNEKIVIFYDCNIYAITSNVASIAMSPLGPGDLFYTEWFN